MNDIGRDAVQLMTIRQVADRCNVSTRTVWVWIRSELLHAKFLPGTSERKHARVYPSDLEAFLAEWESNKPK